MINEDDIGLLTVTSSSASSNTPDNRLIESFDEINQFFTEHKREPDSNKWIQEHKLASRLKGIRGDEGKIRNLKELDKYNLLPEVNKKIESIEDIFKDDDLGILMDESNIFDLRFVKRIEERSEIDYMARRKPCANFAIYEEWFKNCHEDLKIWKRVLNIFQSESMVKKGQYFVLNGILLYIANVTKEFTNKKWERDWRLLCVFENWTESSLLISSLWRAMRENRNGRIVSENEDVTMNRLRMVNEEDKKTGYIYVLKSLSKDTKIQSIQNLYKIWFSTVPIEERIKNAEQETTYLLAPVHLCMSVECYNMNPQKFENIIHIFFGKFCINLDIFDKDGRRHSPREWFSVPFEAIEQAIDMIVEGNILGHEYNNEDQHIY